MARSSPTLWAARASTVEERVARAAAVRGSPGGPGTDALVGDRVGRWAENLGGPARWEARLGLERLPEADVREALEPATPRAGLPTPDWARFLLEAMEGTGARPPRVEPPLDELAFADAAFPFADRAASRLAARTAALEPSPAPEVLGELRGELVGWLATVLAKTLVHEFSLFRRERQGLPARLDARGPGEPTDSLYREFVRCLHAGDYEALFDEYSALGRLVGTCALGWVECWRDLFARLERDGRAIRERFAGGRDPGPVVGIRSLSSDRHDGGRTIALVAFDSGLRLVYKPRSVGLEWSLGRLLAWLGRHGLSLPLRWPRVLDRGTYGWAEFVHPTRCADREEAARFYRRSGMSLALLHVLGATDCHMENVVAAGEHPVLVDGETLISPGVAPRGGRAPARPGPAGLGSALDTLYLTDPRHDPRDVSALLGGRRPGLVPDVLTWRDVNTDRMALRPGVVPRKPGHNLPVVDGRPVPADDHRGEVLAGFDEAHRLIGRERRSLARSPAWRGLASCEVRFLPRSTSVYWLAQLSSLQPAALLEGVDRQIELERLARGLWAERDPESLWPLIRAERRSLERLDIPRLTVGATERDLALPPDGERLAGFFAESAFDRACRRLESIGEEDRRAQLRAIESALSRPRRAQEDPRVE